MGAGGAAPPVRGHDVMILVGSSILLMTFVLHTWVDPVQLEESENWSQVFEMNSDDEFSIEVITGSLDIEVVSPDGSTVNEWSINNQYSYVAAEDGIYEFTIISTEDSKFNYNLSRDFPLSILLYPLGLIILGFGLWKRISENSIEALDVVIED
mgnify:CR=1 FL=1